MRFESLGPLVVMRDGTSVALPPAQLRLLASMLVAPGVPSSIDSLIDRMWAESPPRTAVQAMHVHLSALRRSLPGVVRALNGGYTIDLEDHESDVREFSTLAADAAEHFAQGRFRDAAAAAARASRLWRGEPYPELTDLESARGERERLSELWIANRTIEARALTLQGRVSESIALLRQLVTEQPLNESLWEELALAYCAGGRPAEARSAIADARAVLRAELAVTPGPRLVELERRIEHGDPALIDGTGAVPHNLPLFDSSFVGRDDDIAAITGLLHRHHLVTITGPPGIGKTRLAIEAAARTLSAQPAGAWLVRLVGARTPADVLSTVSTVAGIEEAVESLERLYRLMAPRPMLLLLDNCEHVLEAVRGLLADRRHGDRLRVLATSRSALEVGDEAVWALRPISLPGDQQELWESATLQLLADRVADADPRISLDSTDPAVLLELCRRTGGMPLAVELVARRVATLDPERVATLRFASADGSAASDLPLEDSVARAIARSVAVLGPADRRRFAAASVFADAFTIDAFASICMGSRGNVERAEDAVRRLCEASLLVPERMDGNAVRYRMLEPLRDFGLRLLAGAGRERAVRDRHAAWYVASARGVAEASWTHAEAEMLDAVEVGIADYRAAMRHLLDRGRPHLAAEIAAGLVQFWISRFLAREGERWLDECLAADMDDRLRLAVLAAASGVAFFTGQYDASEARCAEVLEIATRLGDRRMVAQARYGQGRVWIHRRPDEGRALTEEAIAIYEDIGDHVTAAECRIAIGIQAAYAADREAAEAILCEPTALLEAAGYPKIAAVGHRHLALAAWHDGDEAAARRHLAAALNLARQANDRRVLSGVLSQQGMVEGRWGDPSVAADALVQALTLIAGQPDIYFGLVAFGALELLVSRGEWSLAAQVLGHVDRIYAAHGWIPLDRRNAAAPAYRRRIAEGISRTGERLDLAPIRTAAMSAQLIQRLQGPVAAS